jgi:hypothetical protein
MEWEDLRSMTAIVWGGSMDEVSEAELLAAASAGRIAECGADGNRRPVNAELLRRCCHQLKEQIDPRGLRLHSAAIVGTLDLAGLEVPFPVRFDECEFDSPLVVEGAQLHGLDVTQCIQLPGLLGNGLQVHRDLNLSGSRLTGAHRTTASTSKRAAVWLCESDIGGRLLCMDTVIEGGGERSIHADRMHVSGNIRLLNKFTAHGEVRLLGAHIDGSLDLTAATIDSPMTGLALDLAEAVIEGSFFLVDDKTGQRPHMGGRIDMGRARIGGQFLVRNATLEAHSALPAGSAYSTLRAGGTALSAPRLSVGSELTLEGSCEIHGGLDLSMSDLSSLSVGPGCSLHAPGQTSLDLTNAELLSTLTIGDKVPVEGTVRLSGTRIHGNLCLKGAILSAPEGRSLVAAQGVMVDGEAELQNLDAKGGDLGFRAATIGGVIAATGAHLNNPGGWTLSLQHANVKGSIRLIGGFESVGGVVLNRATIEGLLTCGQGTFKCPAPFKNNEQGHAIEAISATIRGGMHLAWTSISPSVDFTDTRTSFLADNPADWPLRYAISGLTYDRFEQPHRDPQDAQQTPNGSSPVQTWDHAARCSWLDHQAVYDAGPYEQAARVFRQHGYSTGAEEILIAQRKSARKAITGRNAFLRRIRDIAYNLTVGYGYRPTRVLWLLALLLILVTVSLKVPTARATMRATTPAGVVYSLHGPVTSTTGGGTAATSGTPQFDACGDGQVRCFNPVLYAVDTVLPLVSLDQRSTWYPDPHVPGGTFMEWWLNAATLLGWLLSSIFVLSLARLARTT